MQEDEELIRKAKKRVKAIKGFYIHLGTYLGTVTFLFIINFLTDPYEWWAFYPTAGWGLGVFFHYLGVFGISGFGAGDWEERAMEREIHKLRRKDNLPADEEETESFDLESPNLKLKDRVREKRDYNDRDLV